MTYAPKVTDEQILAYLERPRSVASRDVFAAEVGMHPDAISHRIKRMRRAGKLDGFEARYIVTNALNNTPVHRGFWRALQVYAEAICAEIIVIPTRYLNVSLFRAGEQSVWYPAEVVKHLCDERRVLNQNLVIMGDVPVQPTAVNPLSGFESLTGDQSGIFGHPQVALRSVPTPGLKLPKLLMTTGSVSLPSYSDTKAGKKGAHHHTLGALVVEIKGRLFFTRHITADEKGAFHDLDAKVTPKGITRGHRVAGLVYGDLHEWNADPDVVRATWGEPGALAEVLRPEVHVIHDALDFYSRNHHHGRDPIERHIKHHLGRGSVRAELESLVDFHNRHLLDGARVAYVDSNHNRALDRWLNEVTPDSDPENAIIYHELRLAQLRAAQEGRRINPLEHYMRPRILNPEACAWLSGNQPYQVAGIDISHHGHIGANGARGSLAQFTQMGGPMTVAHSHSPGINKQAHQVGTSTRLDMGYNVGPSSWLHTHGVIYPDGSRSLVHVINGQWRLD